MTAASARAAVLPALLLLLACAPAAAQSGGAPRADSARTRTVFILGADSSFGAVIAGERVRELVGDARLRQEGTWLRADRVTQYLDRDEILFQNDVVIIDDGDTLRADRVRYDTRTKIGEAVGDVRLADGEVEVFAPAGRYFVDEKRATFTEGVRLVDSTTVLTSRSGAYWTDDERAEFYDAVRLEQPRTTLDADSITYYRPTEVAVARGAVRIVRLGDEDPPPETDEAPPPPADSLSRTLLFGDYAYHDERESTSRVEGDPLLVRLRTDSTGATDTLVVRAVRLLSTRQDSLQRLTAVGDVRVWQTDLAAVADSAVFDRIDGDVVRDDARLFGGPSAWFERTQVTGDTLGVIGRDGGVERLTVRGGAFVAQEDTLTGRIHQLRGRRVVGHFEADTLRRVDVGPNAEILRYRATPDGVPDGAVQATADRLTARFRGGELARASAYEGIEGVFYPEDLIPDGLALDGFRWEPARRPTKSALLPPALLDDIASYIGDD